MRIGCLQFAPQVGDVDNNLNRADAVLNRANPEPDSLDLLVLPELAFSGYNFKSLRDISPFLEPTGAGITSLWARTTALKYNCPVAAGYPEKVDVSQKWPASPEYYNSMIMVNEDGETIANYRKTHLEPTDETWALENPEGFSDGEIDRLGITTMGIGMDLNPYRCEAPWSAYELAFHILDVHANLVILSMTWRTREPAREFSRMPQEPDMDTLAYWVQRLEPLIRAETEEEIFIVFANRTGTEEDFVYAGTSAVIGIKEGEVNVYGLLGRGEKELLVIDTDNDPYAKLVYRPEKEHEVRGQQRKPTPVSTVREERKTRHRDSPTLGSVSKLPEREDDNVPGSAITDGLLAVPEEPGRILGGHVLISQDPASPLVTKHPAVPFDATPRSPLYFWPPSGNSPFPERPTSPTSSTRSNDGRHTPDWDQHRRNPALDTKHIPTVPLDQEPNTTVLSKAGKEPRDVKSPQPTTDGTQLERPSSPKSRNCSRSGHRERSNSALAQRPASVLASRVRTGSIDQRPPHHRSESWNPKSKREPSAARGISGLDFSRAATTSPDLEKIGADLLVFEEGNRPRRDSLECHADEDDFIVLHSSQREQVTSPKKKEPASPPGAQGRASSRTKPSAPKATNRASSRQKSAARQPESSRPTHGRQSSGTRGESQYSPEGPNSRNVSRGRPRNTAWSPKQATNQEKLPHLQNRKNSTSHASSYSSPKIKGSISDDRSQAATAQETSHGSNSSGSRYDQKESPRENKTEVCTDSSVVSSQVVEIQLSPRTLRDVTAPRTPRAMMLPPEPLEEVLPLAIIDPKGFTYGTTAPLCLNTQVQPILDGPKSSLW